MRKNALALVVATFGVVLASVSIASAAVIPPRPPRDVPDASTYTCGGEVGYLRRVFPEQLEAVIDEREVTITPVCEGVDNAMRNDGNASALRPQIAQNEAMVIALGDAAYEPEDVVGVRMIGEGKVILYVITSRY
jgi:hypothetical protein